LERDLRDLQARLTATRVSWPEQAEGIENGRMSRTRSASPPHRQHHRLRDLRPVL